MPRIEREKETVEQMIRLYCKVKEGNSELCEHCTQLLDYAHKRLERCKWGEGKPTCRKCPVHCYKPEMRERVRSIMRFAGPRMLWYHPIDALKHFWREH
ncbi:MAG: nitrous oxide-stimulated promoter family protein [Bacteroidaceae bacterium]|nr:nitrous oxide-stimulated promoter family protein [Bacteroidaceae bacterium]